MIEVWAILWAFLAGWLIGLTQCIWIVRPIVFEVTRKTYSNIYDNAVDEALKRLGNNKKTK